MAAAVLDARGFQPTPVSFMARHAQMLILNAVKDAPLTEIGSPAGKLPKEVAIINLESKIPERYSEGNSFLDDRYPVGIIGAGMAGLYTAIILQYLKIPFEIIEASNRIGGRAFTHRFSETTEFHDYFDVGAMRFPHNKIMDMTFNLFNRVDIGSVDKNGQPSKKLVNYRMDSDNTVMYFNNIRVTKSDPPQLDPFKFQIPKDYLEYKYKSLTGASALFEYAIGPHKAAISKDFVAGWKSLMNYDGVSTRTYLMFMINDPTLPEEKKGGENIGTPYPKSGLPSDVVQWMETMTYSSGWYDRGFTETVLEDLDFNFVDEAGNKLPVNWYCVDGGTETVAKAMVRYLKDRMPNKDKFIHKKRRVISIFQDTVTSPATVSNPLMGIKVQDYPEYNKPTKRYSHIITSVPFPCLRSMDLKDAGLSPKQTEAIRCLEYGPSIKIGIKFKTRWWQNKSQPITGGQSKTDLPIRTVVYPSYGADDPPNMPGVLMASYAWTQDSSRLGALMKGKGSKAEDHLMDIVYRDLAALHSVEADWLREQTVDYFAHDFYQNEYTMGAFAFFNPGQFSKIYTEMTTPAALGNLHIVGEAASTHHAWIVGALESAWRGVFEMLLKERRDDLIVKLKNEFGIPEEFPLYAANAQVFRGIDSERLAFEMAPSV